VVDGAQVVKIREPASKRRKRGMSAFNLDNLPKTAEEATDPVPLDVIQEWATKCGVAPSELSEDDLMQGHKENQE
jgi:hypothetical protein